MSKRPRLRIRDFKIAWICALQVEVDAARAVLDEEYEDIHEAANYTLGRAGRHYVAIACPPAGQIGISAAAMTAGQLRAVFPAIRYWLMVGIGGGVPSVDNGVRLGDVIISQPQGSLGGVVQYDLGKTGPGGQRLRTGFLNAPAQDLLIALTKLRSNINIGRSGLEPCLARLASNRYFARPTTETNVLFEAGYQHGAEQTCTSCLREKIVLRSHRPDDNIRVHCGLIASGNQVIKDGEVRDSLSRDLGGVLCFEMEAAGLMNSFLCLVIRGICDYADSHKNKQRQPFAAAAAASCAKEILCCVSSTLSDSGAEQDACGQEIVLPSHSDCHEASVTTSEDDPYLEENGGSGSSAPLTLTNSTMSSEERKRYLESLMFDQPESEGVLQRSEFTDWLDNEKLKQHHAPPWIKGNAAMGKSIIIKIFVTYLKQSPEQFQSSQHSSSMLAELR